MEGNSANAAMVSLADTGQWRLFVEISADGVTAFLENIDFREASFVLFKNKWENVEADEIVKEVEKAVYANPRMLEDFATHIILTTPRALWIPSVFTEDEEYDPKLFTDIYPADDEDINADIGDEEACLYSLGKGLNSFLRRTLPGSRMSSHLTVLKNAFQALEEEKAHSLFSGPTVESIYLNIRPKEVDVLVFKEGRLQSAATQQWREISDIVYRAMLAAKVYSLDREETELTIVAPGTGVERVATALKEFFAIVNRIETPAIVADGTVSFASAMASGESFQISCT